jgi:hypothetical protein
MTNTSNIREHMDVFGSCGNRLGMVDKVEGNSIKLAKKDQPDNQHHWVPMDWVASVDDAVRLNKGCDVARRDWQSAPTGTAV